jgi:trimethyllysine dioxygenase
MSAYTPIRTLDPNVGMTVINNHRVLHGRSAFDGKRRMCGAYIGMDEYRSKLAVLQEKFATDSVSNPTHAEPDANERSVWNPAL